MTGRAQAIDHSQPFDRISADKFFQLTYENDVFTKTDAYYTQGVQFEIVSPALKTFPLMKLLLQPIPGHQHSGLALEQDVYTPSSIGSDSILYGNRPFAACLVLTSFTTITDTSKHRRFSSSLTTGMIGPAALGREMQTFIHEHINSAIPRGWNNQIHNDAVLNYEVAYEKQLYAYTHLFSFSGDAIARVGTLSDKAGVGTSVMIGYFDSPYGKMKSSGKSNFFVYGHMGVAVIGYDATLQGGLFNRSSPYIISADKISRFTSEYRFGLAFNYEKLLLEYHYTRLSKEFETGTPHSWGGFRISLDL